MICPVIDNPASCKIHIVIHSLHAKSTSAAEIRHELYVVCGQNVMSEGTVRQWCRTFRDRRTNVHDEKQSGRPFVVSDDLVQSVDQKICERRWFTISTTFV
jgi:transposase